MEEALFEACNTGRTDVIKQLLEDHEVDINIIDKYGNTALHVACLAEQIDCVRALLKLQARVDIKNSEDKLAYDCGNDEIQRAFQQELLQHVATGNLEGVRNLIGCGADVNKGDGTLHDATLLHWAASFGQDRPIIEALVQAGANVNATNNSGGTPLHEAAANGNFESAESLLMLGADKSIKDNDGRIPLELVDNDNSEIIALLKNFVPSKEINENPEETEPASEPQSKEVPLNSESYNPTTNVKTSEVDVLKRLLEEKETVLLTLRETVETILQEKGILNYVKRLQEEVDDLDRQLANEKRKNEHITNNHIRSEKELEVALRDNAILRSAIHDKEQRLLTLLEENYQGTTINHAVENGKRDYVTSFENEDENDNADVDVSLLKVERNRLARELENERRHRYEEARIHLAYSNELRKELDATRQQLESRAIILQEGDSNVDFSTVIAKRRENDPEPRGFLSFLYYTFWGDDEDYYSDDTLNESENIEQGKDLVDEGYRII